MDPFLVQYLFFALVFHLKKRAGKISSLPAWGIFIPPDPSR